jgi:hypothetical protein
MPSDGGKGGDGRTGGAHPDGERRTQRELRELLDELTVHVRAIVREGRSMAPDDLHFAQRRLEWLADEIWQSATRGAPRSGEG